MTADVILSDTALEDLEDSVRGAVLQPGDEGYDEARTVWNAMIDKRPMAIVRVSGVADVIRSVEFAREHDLPLAVKGNGHNVAGNAICDGGLTIDLSAMTSVRVDPEAKRAQVEPGATLADVDHETQAFGLVTPLGFVSDTGISGLTLGGGFGYLSRKYGLTIDNLKSVDLVTAEGDLVRVSADEHPELFWGLRGGGGNFGVVTSFEFDLHEAGPEMVAGLVMYPANAAQSVLRHWRDFVADIPDELTVWVIVLSAPPAPFIPEAYHGETIVAVLPIHCGDVEEGERLIEPLRTFGEPIADIVERRSYVEWQQFFDDGNAAGARNYWKSLNFTELTDEAIDRCLEFARDRPTSATKVALAHMGGAITRVDAEETAYPHRDTEFLMNAQVRWEDPGLDETCSDWAQDIFDAMEEFSTHGTYMNFISEDAGKEHFAYRDNYDRLVELKNEWDPDNVFSLNQNVKPTG